MEADLHIPDIAGSETVAKVLSCTINYHCRNHAVLKTLADEIRGAVVVEGDLTIGILSQLPYLTAVLKESLRIYSPTPRLLSRVVPSNGASIIGYWVPGGVHLFVSISDSYAWDIE